MSKRILQAHLRPQDPDFLDLPWHLPPAEWVPGTPRLVELERGVSRHDVRFVNYGAETYAIKWTSPHSAEREYAVLLRAEERRLPCVRPSGWLVVESEHGAEGALVTEFLDGSLPYRTLFRSTGMQRYRDRLLDAMAGLLVRLHLAGFFWGDGSLSNTLFRRDAGELSAYLVDAETSELHETISDGRRGQDLDVLEENVAGELADLVASGLPPAPLDAWNAGRQVRDAYDALWREVTREEVIAPGESWRVQERLRALNALGFSVSEVEMLSDPEGSRLRLRTIVTDRDYHRHELHGLTGISAEEGQARRMMNEIREHRAQLASERARSVPLSVAAYEWQRERFEPVIEKLHDRLGETGDAAELYCEVLENKWFLSEREQHDVGLERALEDYLGRRAPGGGSPAPGGEDLPAA